MGWEEVSVRGYAELDRALLRQKGQQPGRRRVFVYFSGDKDPGSGASWCPDCVKAEPIVRAELPNLPEGAVFIYCQVGDRDYRAGAGHVCRDCSTLGRDKSPRSVSSYTCALLAGWKGTQKGRLWSSCLKRWTCQSWKNPDNEFRKNLKLTGVPTLLKYGTPQKLTEEECFNPELVRMLFTED